MIGAVGALLGKLDINISFMNVGRHEQRVNALMVLTLDEPPTAEQLKQVRQIPDIFSVRLVRL
jgi:D-3-phosphoglycerate dehydrogenase